MVLPVALPGLPWRCSFFVVAECVSRDDVRLAGHRHRICCYSRHAGDTEKIVLQDGQLVVELESAGRTERAAFNRQWVRIEPKNEDGSLIEVSGQGRLVRVGRHVRPELRPLLAREIRFALRTC